MKNIKSLVLFAVFLMIGSFCSGASFHHDNRETNMADLFPGRKVVFINSGSLVSYLIDGGYLDSAHAIRYSNGEFNSFELSHGSTTYYKYPQKAFEELKQRYERQ